MNKTILALVAVMILIILCTVGLIPMPHDLYCPNGFCYGEGRYLGYAYKAFCKYCGAEGKQLTECCGKELGCWDNYCPTCGKKKEHNYQD